MAYQRLSPSLATAQGVTPVAATTDAVNGNVVTNPASLLLELENTTAAAVDVTFVTSATLHGYEVADLTVTLAPAEARVFGHFPADVFGNDLAFTSTDAISVHVYR